MLKYGNVVAALGFVIGALLVSSASAAENRQAVCAKPLADSDIPALFQTLAAKQLRLEFGDKHPIKIEHVHYEPVGTDMFRVEAMAVYHKPGHAEATSNYLTGWISRCQGTLILRGNTWLADGTLEAPRYTPSQLSGHGIVLGDPAAPVHVLAFVDSRCPQCHRLISYARELVKQGKMRIELRQVAYLEDEKEAVKDTRLPETALIDPANARFNQAQYLEMLHEFNNEEPLDEQSPQYRKGLELIRTNTKTARETVHLTNVPGVLIYEPAHKSYRQAGYWEMNRLFQPDL